MHLPSFISGTEGHLLQPTPNIFNGSAVGCDFVPNADPPENWLAFLDSVWPDDADTINVLQEWFGYVLTHDTKHQKILLVVGPKRSGKGTIARILTALIGRQNVAGPTLSSLGSEFGLWPLVGKPLAIISDARLSGRTDTAAVTERLLSISGEDSISVNRKNMSFITARLPTRFMILTNELPRLGDVSGSLVSRFVVLSMTTSWLGKEDKSLEAKLIAELPGILRWSIDGYERLRERGGFVQPASSEEAIQELEDLSSPISAFIRERCEVGPGKSIPIKQMFDAWREWCEANGKDHPGDLATFGRNVRATLPTIRTHQPRISGGSRMRIYQGVGLVHEVTY